MSRISTATAYAVLPAEDLERARKFYRDTLGFEIEEYGTGQFMIHAGGDSRILVYERARTKAEHTAAGLVVKDLDATMEEMRARGVAFEEYDQPGLKTVNGVARIKLGLAKELHLGNLEARRDWGFAGDYVKAMWMMLQQDHPDNFVIGTGETHTVREFCEVAFGHVGLDYKDFVVQDPRFYRPAEVDALVADASKAGRILGWEVGVPFRELVTMMVAADMERLKKMQVPA